MIVYSESKEKIIEQIQIDLNEYCKMCIELKNKISLANNELKKLNSMQNANNNSKATGDNTEKIQQKEKELKELRNQIKKVKKREVTLNKLKADIDDFETKFYKSRIHQYNDNCLIVEKPETYVDCAVKEENVDKVKEINTNAIEIETKEADANIVEIKVEENDKKIAKDDAVEEKLKDNNVLLISEIKQKVFLPYKAKTIEKILKEDKDDCKSIKEIIEKKYTKPLNYYKHSALLRYKETYSLVMRDKEGYSTMDAIDLSLEMMGKRFVHPAIIAACEDTDQLDIYLDCLETNELDDFPFFEVKFEMYPVKVYNKYDFESKNENIFSNFFKKFKFMMKSKLKKEKKVENNL